MGFPLHSMSMSPNSCSILHLNVQSLANKVDHLRFLISDLKCNILCISEHWLKEPILKMIVFEGYTLVSYFCRARLHGGVAIYANSKINSKPINLDNFSIPIHAEFCGSEIINSHTVLITLYRSSSNGDLQIFKDCFFRLINYIYHKYKYIIIVGDLNVELNKKDELAGEFSDVFKSYGLSHMLNVPTRVTLSSASCLDNIITNISKDVLNIVNFDPIISDHHAQFITVDDCLHNNRDNPTRFRSITQKGLVTLCNNIANISWENLDIVNLPCESIASAVLNVLGGNIDCCFPLKRKFHKSKSEFNWYTKTLRTMRNNVFKLKKHSLSTKLEHDWSAYKHARNAYKHALREGKKKAFSDVISNSTNKVRTCWKIVNSERGDKCKVQSGTSSISAEDFNVFFSNISNVILNSIASTNIDPTFFLNNVKKAVSSFFISPILETDVLDATMQLKDSPALDFYNVNSKIVKALIPHLTYPLTVLFNKCIYEGCWPDVFKISKVLPLYKKGDTKSVDNYRPIVIVPVLSKIFEIILKHKLVSYLESKQILSNVQFGFRKYKSTINAVAEVIDTVVAGLDQGFVTQAVMCDLTKAFDCVCIDILVSKLEHYGIRSKELLLFASYLSNRRQYVCCDGVESSILPTTNGVPQGSILGPILFLIYINDLPTAIDSRCVLFADDTTLLSTGGAQSGDSSINQARDWFSSNGLKLNDQKTQSICFLSDRWADTHPPVKLLGLMLDSYLDWKSHVDSVSGKISSQIFVLRQLKNCVSDSVLRSVYYSLIHSHMSYGIIFWGNSVNACRVFRLQKMAVRLLSRVPPGTHCRLLFKNLKILPLPCLFILEVVVYIHRNISSFTIHSDNHNYSTRHANDLVVPHSRIKITKNNKLQVQLYNVLNVRLAGSNLKSMSVYRFKKCVKNYLLDHCFYSIQEFCDHND